MKTKAEIDFEKEWIKSALLEKIDFLGETTLHVKKEDLVRVLTHCKEEVEPSYDVLMDLTAVHYLMPKDLITIVYLLHNTTSLERLRITACFDPTEFVPSVVDLWEGAAWYEREVYDFFGVRFVNHPDLKRILMPDDWIGHPLRKDYPLTEESVEFKHNVTPKIPSEIIRVKWDQKYH